ncbi:MAG: DUF3152 domain-containing protein [Jatrophihabitantaceae bacterium]
MPVWDDDHGRTRSAPTVAPEIEREPGEDADRNRFEDIGTARRGVATFGGERGPGGVTHTLRGFVRRYGWRAYALPILVLVSAAALLTAHSDVSPSHHDSGGALPVSQTPVSPPPTAESNTTLNPDRPGANARNTAVKAAALPAGLAYTLKGTGTFSVLPGTSKVVGSGQLYRYSIEVENGVSANLTQFADLVQSTLADPRSWSGHGVALQRVDSGHIDFHVTLTSSLTVRTLCGYDIPVETSCYIGAGATSPVNRVVLNDSRWARGSAAYLGDLAAYRVYMINHEDGHALGHEHAHECLPGGLAPAMMQQTIGLKDPNTGKLCMANPWPYPTGVKGAPGAEQPDTQQNSEFGINGD